MSIGVLAHLCGKLPYQELAPRVGAQGFRHVQLALWKALSGIDFSKPGKLSPGLASSIAESFAENGVSISVLGCYVHMFEHDEEKRRFNIERFKELIRHARYFGAPIVAAETGVIADRPYNEQDWTILKDTMAELIEEAEKWGVIIGMEPADRHLIGTVPDLSRLLEEMPSSQIGFVFDPGNLITPANIARQDEIFEEAFRLLGNRIVACHFKDRILREDGTVDSVAPGTGHMNYPLIVERLKEYKPGVHIVMDAVNETTMPTAKQYIESFFQRS
ncbi:sugar phosphate isomerase/epimerase family protein [Paenibacillus turpanensis]|uniref:sugar phosphate isomerase/epimerase family protein n=1 Tax=Paenibacillus turpanensis TaxID=2689078 RepID=UPI00140A5340|nr:sugar phosphate isomerase/epimerase family protein [Paenibacillus turpanensis]